MLEVLEVLEVLAVLEVEVLLIAGRGAAPLVSSHDSSVSQNHFGATKTHKHKNTKTQKTLSKDCHKKLLAGIVTKNS